MEIAGSIENFWPVIIFVFWVIGSIIGSNKKLKKNRPTINKPQSSSPSSPPPARGVWEELKKSLQTVVEEMQNPDIAPEQTVQDTFRENTATIEQALSEQGRKDDYKPVAIVRKSVPDQKVIKKMHTAKEYLSSQKLKELILWSEIIAPPISLRDNADPMGCGTKEPQPSVARN